MAGGGVIEAAFEDHHRFELVGIVYQKVQPPTWLEEVDNREQLCGPDP